MYSESVMNWFEDHLPTFDVDVDKHSRTLRVRKYSQICLLLSFIIICIIIPLLNCLLITNKFFKICHHLKHHVFNRRSWVHKTHMYHNQSLQLCLACFVFTTIFIVQGVNRDLLEITKRMGRISVALMPPLLFLTLRPSPLPHTLYLALLPLHKWFPGLSYSNLSYTHGFTFITCTLMARCMSRWKSYLTFMGFLP